MANPDTLSFAVEPFEGTVSVTPVINGVLLSRLAMSFEQEHKFEPAGGYGGIVPTYFNFGPLQRYFLGEFQKGSNFERLGHIYVLGCNCGEVGCWPLACRVRHESDKVIWDTFQQPHRKERDYTQFGPFVFIEEKYRQALAELDAQLSQPRA